MAIEMASQPEKTFVKIIDRGPRGATGDVTPEALAAKEAAEQAASTASGASSIATGAASTASDKALEAAESAATASTAAQEKVDELEGKLADPGKGAAMVVTTQPGTGAASLTQREYNLRVLSVEDYGADGNDLGVDNTDAIMLALAAAEAMIDESQPAASRTRPVVQMSLGKAGYLTTDTITIPVGVDVDMRTPIVYSGPSDRPAIVHGAPGEVAWNVRSTYRVKKQSLTWPSDTQNRGDETEIGLDLLNFNSGDIDIRQVENFEIGFRQNGDATGWAYTKVGLGFLNNNKVTQWLYSANSGWVNENSYYGGRFAATTAALQKSTAVRALRGPDSSSNHNSNTWYSPSFELRNSPEPVIDGYHMRQCRFLNIRDEGNGPILLKEGPESSENEITVGYGPQEILSRVDSSESESPNTVIRSSPRNRTKETHTITVFDSGNLASIACPVESNRVNVSGFVHSAVASGSNPIGLTSTNQIVISDRYLSWHTARAIGKFISLAGARSLFINIDSDLRLAVPHFVFFDSEFQQIDPNGTGNGNVLKTRLGTTPILSPYWGGSAYLSAASDGGYYISLREDVAFLAVYVRSGNTENKVSRIQILTDSDGANATTFSPYPLIAKGSNIGTAPPTEGNSKSGQRILNSAPTDGGPAGWVCTSAGNPGAWKPFGIVGQEGAVELIQAGENISVDNTDPASPVITARMQWIKLTQAEYDGLTSPDENTLYVIVG